MEKEMQLRVNGNMEGLQAVIAWLSQQFAAQTGEIVVLKSQLSAANTKIAALEDKINGTSA